MNLCRKCIPSYLLSKFKLGSSGECIIDQGMLEMMSSRLISTIRFKINPQIQDLYITLLLLSRYVWFNWQISGISSFSAKSIPLYASGIVRISYFFAVNVPTGMTILPTSPHRIWQFMRTFVELNVLDLLWLFPGRGRWRSRENIIGTARRNNIVSGKV